MFNNLSNSSDSDVFGVCDFLSFCKIFIISSPLFSGVTNVFLGVTTDDIAFCWTYHKFSPISWPVYHQFSQHPFQQVCLQLYLLIY